MSVSYAQQDAQYTQYIYNTSTVNPAYAGSRGALSLNSLYRTQWVGLEGAPRTFTLAGHTPLRNEKLGLGVSIVRDDIFIVDETFVDIDFSYTINTSAHAKLAFGLKGGVRLLNIDFSRLNPESSFDNNFANGSNVDNQFSPNIGVGVYYSTDKFYVGYSAPSLLQTEYFDESSNTNRSFLAKDRVNHYLIAGYVFDIHRYIKFKPATLFKAVSGAPLQADFSANFLYNEKFTAGVAYRWGASVSALAGFQVSDELMIGYAYDRTVTTLNNFNSGSHEIFLRFEFKSRKSGVVSPRFF